MMQKIANVEITPQQLALEPCSGTITQADVKTGAVTALVIYPSYDNNQLSNKISWEYYSTLLDVVFYKIRSSGLMILFNSS